MACKNCSKNVKNEINDVKKNNFLIKLILFILCCGLLCLAFPFIFLLIPYFSYKIIFSKKGLNFNFKKNESKPKN